MTERFVHRDMFFSLLLAIGKSCDQWQHLSTVQDVVVSTSCREALHTNSFEEMWSQNDTIFGKKRSGVDRLKKQPRNKHRKHVKTDLWILSFAGAFPYLPCCIHFSRPPVTQCDPALSSLKYGSRDFASKFTAHVIGNDLIFVPMYYESLAADLLGFGKVVKFIV